ncbi:MAG: DUF5357 domain-containing protein [Scytolyngbya sp. HA4215-MV1]|nr:DUF5357 domain-containing protein [Scytolyngbya sp. HA4215-MV1]
MKDFIDKFKKFLTPAQAASWQTFIYLAAFSWAVSFAATGFAQVFIIHIGWLFLIIAVWWLIYVDEIQKALTFQGFFYGPWIVGALICVFLFGNWSAYPDALPYVVWPIVSFIVAAIRPKFFIKPGPIFKIPDAAGRQDLVILLLCNLVLSCWFQLHFSMQDLLVEYPSLSIDKFDRSAFVVKVSSQEQTATKGDTMLGLAEAELESELEGRPWAEVEKWLYDAKDHMQAVEAAVKRQIAPSKENALWHLRSKVLSGRPDYDLRLFAIWQGPSSKSTGYHLSKSCQIQQVRGRVRVSDDAQSNDPSNLSAPVTQAVGKIQCDTSSPPIFEPDPTLVRS